MSKVLVIRLSAIGDVAMTIPVVYSAAEANPDDSFTMFTQTFLMPLFINRPPNVNVMGINTRNTEKSLFGFLRYAFILRKYKFDMVLDLHCVIRSRIVDVIFRLSGKRIFKIDKGRRERRLLTGRPPKEIRRLRPVTERYAEVFHAAGFHFEETFVSLYEKHPVDDTAIRFVAENKEGYRVGIAPFAKHRGKVYPVEKMEKVVEILSGRDDITVFLFGGRDGEKAVLDRWEKEYAHTRNVAGRYTLDKELPLIGKLDLLVCMDSANMHFASLVGTKVISIWGATHPYAGFYGYHQREDLAVQVDLPCRPCSIYGNKPCYRGDWACMNEITPERIVDKIDGYLRRL
ncbi:MAG: glycosyltransferase family 9 protein [Tannerella sp.]|jgi:ADP-heptose:LPS heptosyltransferase|nr:glycosyltransferase family 9 protein [Tannerella sp.]